MRNDAMKSRACGFFLALAAAMPAAACGVCVEDRVAAVYDQPTVDRAVGRRQQVAFYSLNGSLEATPETRRAVIAALERGGVRGTVHVSLESATASVAFDPTRSSVESIAASGDRALAPKALTLEALRVIGADRKLREP